MSMGPGKLMLLDPAGNALVPGLSRYGRQNVGQDTVLFFDSLNLEGTGVRRPHGFRWGAGANTVPQIVATGFAPGVCSFNSGQGTTGTYFLETIQCFRPDPGRGVYARFDFMLNSNPNTTHIKEIGFGNPTG